MTSAEIRHSFLNFFKEKQHSVVPSASLLPQSPGLLFTNAGMNQFVPYFLGVEKSPYVPARATDTQKCIRAGGKHNDLEDVGYDTYHHTFFEMLGNWSFGDYFKREAIQWSWELLTEFWKFPPHRLYATVYAPEEGDPSVFDQEAYDLWKVLFEGAGLDPEVHIVHGGVKDNFWMMGETGPCGPCSELHFDISPKGDSRGALVNADSDLCIEIWNLVFIQYNAEQDGSFRNLPEKHVDTGMGFERVCSIMQNTEGFTKFDQRISNYATDVFSPLFVKLEELSGARYVDLYPHDPEVEEEALEVAIAFRVIADHVRTLSFSIADGIQPGNTGRSYVLRRILRRAVRYGRVLGLTGKTSFLSHLVDSLVSQLEVFPELREKADLIKATLDREEKSFNEKLDRGLGLFSEVQSGLKTQVFPADQAFKLYDTYGFPIDLTALLCREHGLRLDEDEVEVCMEAQRARARAAQKSEVVRATDVVTDVSTEFVGFDVFEVSARVLEIHAREEGVFVILDKTPFYVEKGGQVSDTGVLGSVPVLAVQQVGNAILHLLPSSCGVKVGEVVCVSLDLERREAISSHHTATHLLHWALHKYVSPDAGQQGSRVSASGLRFDFSAAALSPLHLEQLESAVNEAILKDDLVSWKEVRHVEVKERADIIQFFGDKYGELVRVVQIGGESHALNGYSMELCGGTHVKRTGVLKPFIIKKEEAVASGVRRIEALCGEAARSYIAEQSEFLRGEISQLHGRLVSLNGRLQEVGQLPVVIPVLEVSDLQGLRVSLEHFKKAVAEADKGVKKASMAQAAQLADECLSSLGSEGGHCVLSLEGEASLLQELLNGLKKRGFAQAAFLIVNDGVKLHLGAYAGESALGEGIKAGDLLKSLAPLASGKGGGRSDQARGAAPDLGKVDVLTVEAKRRLSLMVSEA